jgi:hypothetical protein
MIDRQLDRRHFAALAGLIVVAVGVIGVLAWRIWDSDEQGALTEPIAVHATLAPPQHMFGDPLRARVEVILDARRVDPESVKLRDVSFAPYRPLQPATRSQDTSGSVTRIRYDYRLACLGYRCLPQPDVQRKFELRNATVEYRTSGGGTPKTEEIDWPTLQATARIPPSRLWEAKLRADYRDLGSPTYSFSPRLVQFVALTLAVLFAAGALLLTLRLLPLARIAERLGLKTVDTRTPLQRALARVHETAERPDEGRRALERLAHELRLVRRYELAGTASQLAWSRQFPADGRLTALSNDIEQLSSEEA